jgi:hypothetical protein
MTRQDEQARQQAIAEAAMHEVTKGGRVPTARDLYAIAVTERDTDSGDESGNNALIPLWEKLAAADREKLRQLRKEVNRIAEERGVYADDGRVPVPSSKEMTKLYEHEVNREVIEQMSDHALRSGIDAGRQTARERAEAGDANERLLRLLLMLAAEHELELLMRQLAAKEA